MGFSEEFIKNASEEVISKSMQNDFNYIEEKLKLAVASAARIAPFFNSEDVSIYLQGSYACKTNTKFQSKIEVIVELKKTTEYDYEKITFDDLQYRDDFFVDFNHYFDVYRFKQVLAEELKKKYEVNVLPMNCAQLKKDDIHHILQNLLYEFPVSVMEFYMPKWVEMLADNHPMKQELIGQLKAKMNTYSTLRDCMENPFQMESEYIDKVKMDQMNLANGCIKIRMDMDDAYYYDMLSGMLGEKVLDEYQLLSKLKEYATMKNEYAKVLEAMKDVRYRGYGIVKPNRDEIELNQPEVIRHGNKYGVKIKAISPSVHMIKANIETEIAPIVGTQQQAEDLIKYIGESARAENGIWETNIFGKTVEQLVNDGIAAKTASIGEECQVKLQDTMQKVVNDSNGGMVCIII